MADPPSPTVLAHRRPNTSLERPFYTDPELFNRGLARLARAGHSIVSDGPFVHIQLGKALMSDRSIAEDRAKKRAITAVDVHGLSTVRIVSDKQEIAIFWCKSQPKFTKKFTLPATAAKYIRVEVHSAGDRSAYSNTIYLP